MQRSYRVMETTDRQHLGIVITVDPDQVPADYTLPDGDVIKVTRIERFEGGMRRVSNPNYIAWLMEITE